MISADIVEEVLGYVAKELEGALDGVVDALVSSEMHEPQGGT